MIDFTDHSRSNWSELADETPEVFRLATIAPQGEDGVAHFNYYDSERALSFQWNGRMEQHVTVSHGGYGEPVKWTFDFMETWNLTPRFRNSGPVINNPFLDPCLHFRGLCNLWIRAVEDGVINFDGDEVI